MERHLDNPYLAAWALAGSGAALLSHGTAMELHGMRAADWRTVTTVTPKRVRNRAFEGSRFVYLLRPPRALFGGMMAPREALALAGVSHHLDALPIFVTDLERTVLDGLAEPHLVGGLAVLAAGLGRRRRDLDLDRLVDHALRLGSRATTQRLGLVMEQWLDAPSSVLSRVEPAPGSALTKLDARGPRRGRRNDRWLLRLNAGDAELETWAALARGTLLPSDQAAHAPEEAKQAGAPGPAPSNTTPKELVLEAVRGGARTPDAVACAVPLPLSVLSEALYELEVAGLLRVGWAGLELAG